MQIDHAYVIASLNGGSHLYGLNTPESDLDERVIFVNTQPAQILGLSRHDNQTNQDDDITKDKKDRADQQGYELRHFLRQLQQGNSQCLELLFADASSFTWLAKEFELIRKHRMQLIDTEKFYRTMKGYALNELRIATGASSGQLGSKRKKAFEKFGYSPANYVHFLRLSYTAWIWFKQGRYIVSFNKDKAMYKLLMDIKLHPEQYAQKTLVARAERHIAMMNEAFAQRTINTKFDLDVANSLCMEIYFPILSETAKKN